MTILRHLDRAQFQLALGVLDMRDPVYLQELPADVECIDLGCRRVRYSAPAILRVVWKRRPQVVFSTLGHLNLAIALMKPLLPSDVTLIAREAVVVSDVLPGLTTRSFWTIAYRRLYKRFDRVVCQSHAMERELVEKFGFPAYKATVIHNPIDIERVRRLAAEPLPEDVPSGWGEGSDTVWLVAAGRLRVEKGFDLLIEAIALLKDPRIHVTILGDGPLRDALVALARELGVADRIELRGFEANPYRFFARASAFVLSSRSEAFPNVVLEALACGAPVIATPASGGILEIVEGRRGCVIAEEVSAKSLAGAIAKFATNRMRDGQSPALPTEFAAERISAEYAKVLSARSWSAA